MRRTRPIAFTLAALAFVLASIGGLSFGAPLSVNIEGVNDWQPFQLPADLVKQSRPWGTVAAPHDGKAIVDANGWPTGDAGVYLVTQPANSRPFPFDGTYRARWQGKAKLAAVAQSPSGSVQPGPVTCDEAGACSAEIVVAPGARQLVLTFTATTGGIRSLEVMRPGHEFGERWNRAALARMTFPAGLRGMQAQGMSGKGVNGNRDEGWGDRQRPDAVSWARAGGVPLELLVSLANQLGKNLWINVPPKANADYVFKMAQLLRNGSDGREPYAAPVPNPTWAPLRSGLVLFVERGNEYWLGSYQSTLENQAAAKAEFAAGDPYYYTAGTDLQLGLRRMARLIVEDSSAFRRVFGDCAMGTAVRPVLASQIVNKGTYDIPLAYIARVFGPANTYGNPRVPVSFYLYGLAGAPYVDGAGTVDGLTVDQVFEKMAASNLKLAASIQQIKALADANALKLLGYEGGPGLIATGSKAAKLAAQMDPRMKTIVLDLDGHWQSAGGEDFFFYTLVGPWGGFGYFGLWDDVNVEAGVKWEAVRQILAAP